MKRPSRLEPRTYTTGTHDPTTPSPTLYRLSYGTGNSYGAGRELLDGTGNCYPRSIPRGNCYL